MGIAAVLAVSLAVARGGVDGRWTVYLLILVYVPIRVRLLSLFGTASTPLLGIPLLLILLGLVLFDRRVGRAAFAYFIVILAAKPAAQAGERWDAGRGRSEIEKFGQLPRLVPTIGRRRARYAV